MKSKLIFGLGVCDSGQHQAMLSGRPTRVYQIWYAMFRRCYGNRDIKARPTYIDCTVCDEWRSFQTFADWYYANYPKDGGNYQLDKDLKILGNKVYSPETCLFVSRQVNMFTIDCGAKRGDLMIGVSIRKDSGMFVAQCGNPSIKRKNEYLGQFESELQAHLAWRKRKSELAYELAMTQENPEVADALLQWKLALDNNIIHPY